MDSVPDRKTQVLWPSQDVAVKLGLSWQCAVIKSLIFCKDLGSYRKSMLSAMLTHMFYKSKLAHCSEPLTLPCFELNKTWIRKLTAFALIADVQVSRTFPGCLISSDSVAWRTVCRRRSISCETVYFSDCGTSEQCSRVGAVRISRPSTTLLSPPRRQLSSNPVPSILWPATSIQHSRMFPSSLWNSSPKKN